MKQFNEHSLSPETVQSNCHGLMIWTCFVAPGTGPGKPAAFETMMNQYQNVLGTNMAQAEPKAWVMQLDNDSSKPQLYC